ncbi:2-hydroxyacid dehydrogenase [Tychonema sp. BBK16]|uniref:2-hydroxyacid dehydrogenase n=1 Tax=Tychonema sp. BBK16 TaxID=2699888 RepID=UPI001F260306|nr:2-hydroxyacid dehydrogenase [Tychonema sp. BBK16]MCF6374867.1 2-hydroxyacid dehydrogenase [Tychonema sp. BBK16]
MKVGVFSTKSYDRTFLEAANVDSQHDLVFFEPRLTLETSILATGLTAICAFVNDQLDAKVLSAIAQKGVRLIALRSAGFNHVDLAAARDLELTLVRVPAYSPYAVAEHAVAMILCLNRGIHRAYNRVREDNFSLEGLLGFDLHGRTIGIVGTGKIGALTAKIMHGFGCRLVGYDVSQNSDCQEMGMEYVSLPELFATSDIVSLHCPLMPETYHLINTEAINQMKVGVMLINTSRGQLIDTKAVTKGLKSGKIGYLGLDVYEQESDLFFEDLSNQVIQDDVFQRLLTFPNVLITGHQAFFTEDALRNIATTTIANITDFEQGKPCPNQVSLDRTQK